MLWLSTDQWVKNILRIVRKVQRLGTQTGRRDETQRHVKRQTKEVETCLGVSRPELNVGLSARIKKTKDGLS